MSEMSLMEHLVELRKRIIYSLLGVLVGFGIVYYFSAQVFAWLIEPLCHIFENAAQCSIVFTDLTEPFFVYLKVGFVGGIFLAAPWIFYQIWCFISPGLRAEERKYVVPFVVIASLMFIGGALSAYYFFFPVAFHFLISQAVEPIRPMLSMGSYYSFASTLLLVFGIVSELPVLIILLNVLGVLSAAGLWRTWRIAVAAIFIAAAIITPPDPYSMLFMAIPLSLLYLLSLVICSLLEKLKARSGGKNSL
ncbi:MAG: twin-arginine translocase subunit TatC [Deltaproteobacteria bacterium]|nr:twin-arginine translocase subunit TatC [Deltaproteobacteria bacterium]